MNCANFSPPGESLPSTIQYDPCQNYDDIGRVNASILKMLFTHCEVFDSCFWIDYVVRHSDSSGRFLTMFLGKHRLLLASAGARPMFLSRSFIAAIASLHIFEIFFNNNRRYDSHCRGLHSNWNIMDIVTNNYSQQRALWNTAETMYSNNVKSFFSVRRPNWIHFAHQE